MLHDPEKERRRRSMWYKVKGFMFLIGLTTSSILILIGIMALVVWVAKGIL